MPDPAEPVQTIAEQVQAVIDGTPEVVAETPEVAETPAETPETPESTTESAKADETPAEEVKEPEIDAALVDAALQSGWSEEDIKDHVKEVGADRATKTLRSMHDRLLRDVDALAAPLAQPQYQPIAPPPVVHDAKRQALEAKLADADPELATEIKAVLAQQDQGIAQHRAYQAQQQVESAARIVNAVIDRDFASKSYADVYGAPGARLTRAQAAMRREVFETADALAGRYRQLGRPITDEDAIVRAHLSVNRERVLATAATAKAEATKEIRKSLETRQKARSIPPTSTVRPEVGGDWERKAQDAIDSARKR